MEFLLMEAAHLLFVFTRLVHKQIQFLAQRFVFFL
jgi:hypothetical protein